LRDAHAYRAIRAAGWGVMKPLMLKTGFYEVLSQYNQPEAFFSAIKGCLTGFAISLNRTAPTTS
jgi:hypothetical protein